ncbi:hypothetical protein PG984_007280 [Apiospora sp. TS-2023a]
MDNDRFALNVVSRIEDLSQADQTWFYRMALHAVRMTIPDAVLDDILPPNGRFAANVGLWMDDIFKDDSWNSTMAPPAPSEPRVDLLEGCYHVGSFKQDLPRSTKTRHDWAKALERGNAEIETNQRDHLRKRGAEAYLRARVDRIDDSVVFEYVDKKLRWVPAQFVAFAGGRTGPSDEARAMALQDTYQAEITVQWNGRLVVYLFRKRLYNSSNLNEFVPPQGKRFYTAQDFRKTPKVVETMESLLRSIHNVRRILQDRGVRDDYYPLVH